MEILDQLALGLGLATLAGVNLYLTVLVVGLAIRFDWLHLHGSFEQLSVLSEPLVLSVAGVMFAFEFFADKVPWVDSLWDTIHTLVRPVGGGLMGMAAIGDVNPALQVVIALAAGGTSLVSHGAKAGTRLGINTSPEPVSNTVVSLAEDAVVFGGSLAAMHYPKTTAFMCLLFLATALWVLPKMLRRIMAAAWFFWNKLRSTLPGAKPKKLTASLDPREAIQLGNLLEKKAEVPVRWAVPVATGASAGMRGMSGAMRGKLIALADDDEHVYFVGRRNFRNITRRFPLAGACYLCDSRFLSEDLSLTWADKNAHLVLRLSKAHTHLMAEIVNDLRARSQIREMISDHAGMPAVAAPTG